VHLSKIFESYPREITIDEERELLTNTNTSTQMPVPAMPLTINEVRTAIRVLHPTKAPGYDLITNQVLQKLPEKGIRFITQLCNAVLRQDFFPSQWKAQIIMIQKLGKSAELAKSYRPISLLLILSKLFEKLLLPRLLEIIERRKIIPNHQFGFRPRHATTEQIYRIVKKINTDMDAGRYCEAAFLNVSQAFDKVWHASLFHKIKSCFPPDLYAIVKSYLLQRTFRIKFGEVVTQLKDINFGVPQGSVLGPVLYLLYTADLPVAQDTITATYADDTAILTAHKDHVEASQRLQKCLFHI